MPDQYLRANRTTMRFINSHHTERFWITGTIEKGYGNTTAIRMRLYMNGRPTGHEWPWFQYTSDKGAILALERLGVRRPRVGHAYTLSEF